MDMRHFWLMTVSACLLVTGCAAPKVSVLKPESLKLHVGMQPEEVEAVCGKPQMNITDPLGGAAMWQYRDEQVGDHLTVMFNMDGVATVKYVSN